MVRAARPAERRTPSPRHGDTPPALPNFVVIGAMKAGTTSLFHYLEAHPQVYMPAVKETDFFVEELNWHRGVDWYRRRFRAAGPDAVAVGEASPAYTKYPLYGGVPERMAELIPNARLIYLVRDPIERIRSHYEHCVLVGMESAPIDVAVFRDPRYLDCSRYGLQIARYLRHFPSEQILIVRSEDLRGRREETVRSILRFLEVDDDVLPSSLDREFYRTNDREAYPAYVWWLRRNLKRVVPPEQRWRARRTVSRALERAASAGSRLPRLTGRSGQQAGRAVISPELRERLIAELRSDVNELRRHTPDGFDGWGIAA
jgi:sulfotransferase family protein